MKLKRIFTSIISTVALSTLVVSSSLAANEEQSAAKFSPQQVKSIHKIIKNYLINNPQVLLEVSAALRKQMQEKQQAQAMGAIKNNKQALFSDKNSPVVGNPQGTKVLVEFFDYQCPHCKEVKQVVTDLIEKNKDLKVILKDWPIFGGASATAAKAAIAAQKQGKYLPMHQALLEAKNPLTKEKVMKIAKKLGLNMKQLKKDMDSAATQNQIKTNFDLARKLGLVGTPAFILTNKKEDKFKFVPGATTEEHLQKILNAL